MGKIIHDEQNGYEFISDRGIKYSLYEGKSIDGNVTSDMVFVMCDTESDLDDAIGNLDYIYVGWFFGASCMKDDGFRIDAQNIINNMVNKYEDTHPQVVNYFCPTLTEEEIKEMVSVKLLKNISDYPTQTVLRRVLYYDNNSIDWKDFYEQIITQMPELKGYRPRKETDND